MCKVMEEYAKEYAEEYAEAKKVDDIKNALKLGEDIAVIARILQVPVEKVKEIEASMK